MSKKPMLKLKPARARAPTESLIRIPRGTESTTVHGPYTVTKATNGNGLFIGNTMEDSRATMAIKDELKTRFKARFNKIMKKWWIPKEYEAEVIKFVSEAGTTKQKQQREEKPLPDRLKVLYQLIEELDLDGVASLVELDDEEIDYLIDIIELHDKKEKLKDRVAQTKIALLLDALASKLCRCVAKVSKSHKDGERAAYPICISRIFKKRGLKMNKIDCGLETGVPILKPSRDNKVVLRRQPGVKSILMDLEVEEL